MPVIAIPALIRNLTDGEDSVTVEGATIREVLNNLESQYPGTKAKLCDGDRIHPSIGVYINGVLTRVAMHDRVNADAELHFLPAISGGVSSGPEELDKDNPGNSKTLRIPIQRTHFKVQI